MAKKPAENYSKKTIGFNFYRPTGAITSLTSITSELAKVQIIIMAFPYVCRFGEMPFLLYVWGIKIIMNAYLYYNVGI